MEYQQTMKEFESLKRKDLQNEQIIRELENLKRKDLQNDKISKELKSVRAELAEKNKFLDATSNRIFGIGVEMGSRTQ